MMTRFLAALVLVAALASSALAVSRSDVPLVTVQELKMKLDRGSGVIVLDVRSRGSYASSDIKIPGSVRIPPDELRSRAAELPFDKEIVAYCSCPDESSSIGAGMVLMSIGFQRVSALKGGLAAWVDAGYPFETK